ncbi:MAG: amidophosphoribosyltransferase [Cellvibrio sp. 79]|nr:MAG: amidophosphoribosyltransferase [Cellvibrio sp. 79]
MLKALLNQVLPNHCLLCGDASGASLICNQCSLLLPRLRQYPHLCNCCSLPLKVSAPLCGHCLKHQPAFARSYIAFSYEHPLDYLIHQFKYRRQLASGKLLGEMLAEHCRQAVRPDFLVPTPIHWRKRWQRGFNQTELLARQLGKALRVPVMDALRQTRYHESQKSLGRQQRQKNLRQSLALNRRYLQHIRGAHIALIDDVVTTTATARALSELLIKAGAQKVDIWALARTPDH